MYLQIKRDAAEALTKLCLGTIIPHAVHSLHEGRVDDVRTLIAIVITKSVDTFGTWLHAVHSAYIVSHTA